MKTWFEVDKAGLRALQAGKSKTFIINELVQNAWDQNIKYCFVTIRSLNNYLVEIVVADDDPNGFSDLTHAYTLFANTSKRHDPSKRGRFNLGEKQVLSICDSAVVTTTKGTITFDERGRTESLDCTEAGSIIQLFLKASREEVKELIAHAKSLLVPEGIEYQVNTDTIKPKPIFSSFEVKLNTELLQDEIMREVTRTTKVNLLESDGDSYIFEMGIPVMKTDCCWHIDIQQKIPLAVDRQTIKNSYLKDLYMKIVNNIYKDIPESDISSIWVRTGCKHKNISKNALKYIIQQRCGEKALIGNPFDAIATDEAISHGYNIINGSSFSKEEWGMIKEHGLLNNVSSQFGHTQLQHNTIEPTIQQKAFAYFAKKVASEYLNINITVVFVKDDKSPILADYGNNRLRFNTGHSKIHSTFFNTITAENLDLLLHELGHEGGNHTEHNYHKAITRLAGKLIIRAITDPEFFKLN